MSQYNVKYNGDETTVLGIEYLDLNTVVYRTNPETFMTLIGSGTGDAGDQYTGLDRFGRVVDLTWSTGGSGATVNDRYQYGYDLPDLVRCGRPRGVGGR